MVGFVLMIHRVGVIIFLFMSSITAAQAEGKGTAAYLAAIKEIESDMNAGNNAKSLASLGQTKDKKIYITGLAGFD